jgi:hypothetical protein
MISDEGDVIKVACYIINWEGKPVCKNNYKTARRWAVLICEIVFQPVEFFGQYRILGFNKDFTVREDDGGDAFVPMIYLPNKFSRLIIVCDVNINERNLGLGH